MPQAQPELKKVRHNSNHPCALITISKTPIASIDQTYLKNEKLTMRLIQYLDKRVEVQLNGSRKVMGTLRGYDVRSPPTLSPKPCANQRY